jgi:hypothetical protein
MLLKVITVFINPFKICTVNEIVCELRWNPRTKRKEPIKIREDPTYFFKWNPKEVKKLIEKSEVPCQNFYIGLAFGKGQGTGGLGSAHDLLAVKNLDDFLNGDFDNLALLNRAGIMIPEASTLHMVDKAKNRFEEEGLKRIALARVRTYIKGSNGY